MWDGDREGGDKRTEGKAAPQACKPSPKKIESSRDPGNQRVTGTGDVRTTHRPKRRQVDISPLKNCEKKNGLDYTLLRREPPEAQLTNNSSSRPSRGTTATKGPCCGPRHQARVVH